ncbi:MAG TPA: hypothetical protein VHM02_09835 [Thermoanaerobaculia bacterium]|nr:hypothetical protein [Thermoanaerobaculia bacterium]
MRFASVIALLAACGTFAAAEPTTIRTASSPPETVHPTRFRAHYGANACSPLDTIAVGRFEPVVATIASEIEVAIHVDAELIGTETIRLAEMPTSPVRLEILRFQPQVRQRLITRALDGAVVDARSPSLMPEIVRLTAVREPAIASDLPTAQIVRSTWQARSGFENYLRPQPSVRPTETELTRLLRASAGSCFSQCHEERLLCEEQRCDFSPCAGCDAQYDDCADLCPCDTDPVLVRQFATQERIIVSGPHGSVCLKDAFSTGNVFYDVYTVFTRTRTYRVWEDCHGDQTTELVSTQDSGNHTCYAISDQFCSPAAGPPPVCRIP